MKFIYNIDINCMIATKSCRSFVFCEVGCGGSNHFVGKRMCKSKSRGLSFLLLFIFLLPHDDDDDNHVRFWLFLVLCREYVTKVL